MDFRFELSETVYKKEKKYAKSDAQKNDQSDQLDFCLKPVDFISFK